MAEEKEIRALPAPQARSSVPAVPEQYTLYPSSGYPEPESEEPVVPLSHYLWILRRHKWKLLAFVVFCVAATVVVSSRLTPIYEATASIDIDRQMPTGVIGQDAARMAPNDADQFLATQVKTIQSDSVLRPVVERFKLAAPPERAAFDRKLPLSRVHNAPVTPTPSPKATSCTPITSALPPLPASPPSWRSRWKSSKPKWSAPPPPWRSSKET